MTIKHVFQIGLLTLLLVVTGCARPSPDNYVIDHGGIRLSIPKQYLLKPHGWWGDLRQKAKGLDTSANSVNIQIPASEANAWLPAQAPKFEQPLGVLLWVYNAKEMAKGYAAARKQVQNYIDGKGMYGSLTIEPDKVPGWYRIYDGSDWKVMWSVALLSPQQIKQNGKITGNEILGSCVDQKPGPVNCDVYLLEKPGFFLQVNLDENQLPYYEPIQKGLLKLLDQWRQ